MTYLDGSGSNLDVMQFSQSTLSVYEIGGSQLVQGLQSHSRAVTCVVTRLCFLTQLPLVHKYSQSLLS